MKTREQAEARALELYPIHEEFDVDRLKELREAYLQGWEEMQQDKCERSGHREQSLKAIDEFLKTEEGKRYISEMQANKQTCGFCVEPVTELTSGKHSESLDSKEDKGSELHSEKQKELLCEMMSKDEEIGMYELTKDDLKELVEESKKEINLLHKDKQLREAAQEAVNAYYNHSQCGALLEKAVLKIEKALK